jgi:hypothetical protein
VKANLRFYRLAFGSRMQPALLADMGPDFPAWVDEVLGRLEAYFRDAGAPRPDIEAALLLGTTDGIHQQYALDPEGYPIDEVVGLLADRYAADAARWRSARRTT